MTNISHDRSSSSSSSHSAYYFSVILLVTGIKCLLIPSYHSTDFDVHRNWLALTRHLPLSRWYFDDLDGGTVHTLDYPPGFAFFEWGLSRNYGTEVLLQNGWLDANCLELLPDSQVYQGHFPSENCIKFQRWTVILSDVLLYIGAYFVSHTMVKVTAQPIANFQDVRNNGHTERNDNNQAPWLIFTLIVTNPGLIMLDHIHFQYNGMLLGILLISIACILQGSQIVLVNDDKATKSNKDERNKKSNNCSDSETTNDVNNVHSDQSQLTAKSNQGWEILGAAFFAVLLTMKHLYLTLAPLYFVYLLRHHCFISTSPNTLDVVKHHQPQRQHRQQQGKRRQELLPQSTEIVTLEFSCTRFLSLTIVTLICFVGPFVPFLIQPNPIRQMAQIATRLFPFGRGLVHDYWAANVWALYRFLSRMTTFVFRQKFLPSGIQTFVESFSLVPFQEPSPSIVAMFVLIGLIPVLIYTWKIAGQSLTKSFNKSSKSSTNLGEFFIHALVASSLTSFMLGYHVHEKAIMTAIIPLTLLATTSFDNARLFIRTCLFGVFGLFPLLFRPQETLLKLFLFLTWMIVTVSALENFYSKKGKKDNPTLLTSVDMAAIAILACVFVFMEIIHPIVFLPRGLFEFLPLMMTSVCCAVGLFYCWIFSTVQMFKCIR